MHILSRATTQMQINTKHTMLQNQNKMTGFMHVPSRMFFGRKSNGAEDIKKQVEEAAKEAEAKKKAAAESKNSDANKDSTTKETPASEAAKPDNTKKEKKAEASSGSESSSDEADSLKPEDVKKVKQLF